MEKDARKCVVTFGEILLRFNPKEHDRFLQADDWESSYGGAEANVSVSLANFGLDTTFITKVPEHEIGQCAVNALRHYGVHISQIVRGGSRLGIYFMEEGASQRASKVIYDRTGSSFAQAVSSDFKWEEILANASWFHFTGITPALGGCLPEICKEACKCAKKLHVPVSCDLNYRSKLWSKADAAEVMKDLLPYVDVFIGNITDANDILGISAPGVDIETAITDPDAEEYVTKTICDTYGCSHAALTLRKTISAEVNEWGGMIYDGNSAYFSPRYTIEIVDRVGGGDSFGAALIYSFVTGMKAQDAINFAVAASCLKQTIKHDFNLVSVDEVKALASGKTNGRVQR